jgi:hypothetical protein
MRLRVFERQKEENVNLGEYRVLTETEDLKDLVGRLMRRVEDLEWEREMKRRRVLGMFTL